MKSPTRAIVWLLLLAGVQAGLAQNPYPLPVTAGRRELTWAPVTAEAMDVQWLTDQGRRALEFPGLKWEHAQSDHFVVHFEREIFAKKVGRMAEFYYGYISDDIEGPQDRMNGRSHIFVFRTPEKWREFLSGSAAAAWSFSFVEGPVMYLQEAGDLESSAGVLAHEMSHLILNRFFSRDPPMWLNEGLAEWYGTFAYAAFKGVKKSRRAEFKSIQNPYPFTPMLTASEYPQDPAMVSSFYQTAKFAVAYLRLAWPESRFVAYLKSITEGGDPEQALRANFDINSPAEFEAGFAKFLR